MLYNRSQMTQLFSPSKLASSVWCIAWPRSPRATGPGTLEGLEDAPTGGKGSLRGGASTDLYSHHGLSRCRRKQDQRGQRVRLGLRGFSQAPCREPKEVLCPHGNSGTPSQVWPADANSAAPTLSRSSSLPPPQAGRTQRCQGPARVLESRGPCPAARHTPALWHLRPRAGVTRRAGRALF